MNKFILFFLLIPLTSFSQKDLKQLLQKYNTEKVPYISVDSLSNLINLKNKIILLDSREQKEFKISHLKNAICIGFDNFDIHKTIQKIPSDKKTTIIVYCSLGIRSETIAEKLLKAGYINIYNLYGGIFEWKNKNNTVVNSNNNPTEKIHTFNKTWSKWLLKGEKIYE